jgi:hypothetical protein
MISTFSKFYYGFDVSSNNNQLDFKEGAGSELTAEIAVGSYTATNFVTALKIALDAAGALTYTASFNRSTRAITISTTSTFSLLSLTGTHTGASAYSLMGFATSSDKTGASTYTGSLPASDNYAPQFKLQEYVSSDDYQQAVDATVNKTASGQVEVVKFGIEKFIEANIMFATDISQDGNVLISNASGVADLRRFLQFLVTKSSCEFMADSASPSTFQTVMLETTPESDKGVSYKLKEMYDRGLPGYFQSGKLKFRVLE